MITSSDTNISSYKLVSCTIVSDVNGNAQDLRGLFTSFEIYEDMFSPYITAKISINDTFNIPETLPISGQESVFIEFETEKNNITKVAFRVNCLKSHKISNSVGLQTYDLHLISECGYINFSQRCGYSLSGSTKKMVDAIIDKHFPQIKDNKKIEIEETKDKYKFVFPATYTPLKAISWLASVATNSDDYSPFFFYETLSGYFFRSLKSIYASGSANVQKYFYGYQTSVNRDSVLILDELTRFNTMQNIMNGCISSKLITHDLYNKQKSETILTESQIFESKPKLGITPLWKSQDRMSVQMGINKGCSFYYRPSTSYTIWTKNNNITQNDKSEIIFLKRKHHITALLTQKISIVVAGNAKRHVGEIIELVVPSSQNTEKKTDKNISGRYVITALSHCFDVKKYTCNIELSRDSMGV